MPVMQGEPIARRNGVVLVASGEGESVFVVPGMEGSGESCLHLVQPVLEQLAQQGQPCRLVLVDYAAEDHASVDELIATVHGLMRDATDGARCIVWGQSFGNLVAAGAASLGGVDARTFVFVSPFIGLPTGKVLLGTLGMRMTPAPLFRATIRPIGQYIFGPAGDNRDHPFFDALRRTSPEAMRRRTAWLQSRLFTGCFTGLPAPAKVWLGKRDRLVDLPEQERFFAALGRSRSGYGLSLIESCGHVVLPSAVAHRVCREIVDWLTHQTGP